MSARAKSAAIVCCHAFVLSGCGGAATPTGPSTTPPPAVVYENLAGTWTGAVGGVSQGVTLAGTLTLVVQQSSATLSGTYSVAATLTSSTQVTPLQGSVTLGGTVASGPNPAVTITTQSTVCPDLPGETWTGNYGNATGVLTLTGTGHVITSTCVIVLNYPQTILLTR